MTDTSVPLSTRILRVPARVDFALRALVMIDQLAGEPVKARQIATTESIPIRFLSTILIDLRAAGVLQSRRGNAGGYWLARPGDEITVLDVYLAIDLKQPSAPPGSHVSADLWCGVDADIRAVLRRTTVNDLRIRRQLDT